MDLSYCLHRNTHMHDVAKHSCAGLPATNAIVDNPSACVSQSAFPGTKELCNRLFLFLPETC